MIGMDNLSKNIVLLYEYGANEDKIKGLIDNHGVVMRSHLFEDIESIVYQYPDKSNIEVIDLLIGNGRLDDAPMSAEFDVYNFLKENRNFVDDHVKYLKSRA